MRFPLPRLPRQLFVILSLLTFALPSLATPLPRTVAQALARAAIPENTVAIWVQAVDATTPTLQHGASKPMNPASVMKLVTAFAALERLGLNHSWQTRLLGDALPQDGILPGDLYLVGSGDPVLTHERLWKLFNQLQVLGVHEVSGDIVLDDSVFRLPPHNPFAFDGKGYRPYNSAPSGLLLNFSTLQLLLRPAEKGGAPVQVSVYPRLAGLEVTNRLRTTDAPCGVWYQDLSATIENARGSLQITLNGTLPARCYSQSWGISPLPPERFNKALVAALWQDMGGRLGGQVRAGRAPKEAVPLSTLASPGVGDVVREMNKWSSNVIARQLIAALGSRERQADDMVTAGVAAVHASLHRAGITAPDLVIENGAGLSRKARISAHTLGQMLLAAWRHPFMPEFMSAMPLAGLDGTAHRYLRGSNARGHAHIKTGSINDVRAIAGFMLDRHGKRHALVMMVNHPKAAASRDAQNALLEWLWQGE